MLSEELLRAVIDAPDDDAPRLVIADALQAAGDPRGEFIAVQCELASGKPIKKTRRATLERLERKLLKANERAWLVEAGFDGYRCKFRRGFIEEVAVHGTLGAVDEERWRRSPIRQLLVSGKTALAQLLEHPLLGRLDGLELSSCEPTVANLARLAGTTVRSLGLYNDRIPVEALEALGQSPALRELTVKSSPIGESGVESICASPLINSLVLFDFRENDRMDRGDVCGLRGAHIAANAPWQSLTSLALVFNLVDDNGAIALAASPSLAKVHTLTLPLNLIRDPGIEAIARSPNLRALRALDLSFNDFRAGARALADPANLPALETLDLRYVHHIGSEIVGQLKDRLGDGLTQF